MDIAENKKTTKTLLEKYIDEVAPNYKIILLGYKKIQSIVNILVSSKLNITRLLPNMFGAHIAATGIPSDLLKLIKALLKLEDHLQVFLNYFKVTIPERQEYKISIYFETLKYEMYLYFSPKDVFKIAIHTGYLNNVTISIIARAKSIAIGFYYVKNTDIEDGLKSLQKFFSLLKLNTKIEYDKETDNLILKDKSSNSETKISKDTAFVIPLDKYEAQKSLLQSAYNVIKEKGVVPTERAEIIIKGPTPLKYYNEELDPHVKELKSGGMPYRIITCKICGTELQSGGTIIEDTDYVCSEYCKQRINL